MRRENLILLAVNIIAVLFLIYAVVTEGYEENKKTIVLTVIIFGIPSLIWIIGSEIYNKSK